MTKSGKVCFTKIRKWAEKVGAEVVDSEYFDKITITFKGKKFEAEQRESTSSRVIRRGGGTKWSGNPAGFYFTEIYNGYRGYATQSTQARAIKEMEKYL